MKALYIAWKDIQLTLRDRGAIITLFLLPLLFIIVTSGALGAVGQSQPADVRIPLAWADLDGGHGALDLARRVEAAGGVELRPTEEAVAMQRIRDNDLGFVLIVPADFSSALDAGRSTSLRFVRHPNANQERAEAVRLVLEGVTRDMALESQILASLQQMGEMLADAPPQYQEAFAVERTQAQARAQFERAQTEPLIEIVERVPTTAPAGETEEQVSMSSTAVPGYAVLFVFLAAQAMAHSIFEEKSVGSFRRLLAAPLSKVALLVGKMLPNFVTALLQVAVIFAFGTVGLRLLGLTPVSLGRDPLALVVVVILIAFCSTALGLVIAALASTEAQVSGMSTFLLWVMAIVGGSIIPLFALEAFLGPLPRIVPHYWANRALDSLMLRGLTLGDLTTELLVLLGFGLLFFAIGLWRFDFE